MGSQSGAVAFTNSPGFCKKTFHEDIIYFSNLTAGN